MKLYLRIVSLFAMTDPDRFPFSWQGEVDLGPEYADAPDTEICDRIFRLFNRVDESDGPRLEALGYRLPSLSATDIISFVPVAEKGTSHMQTYRVASMGFKLITPGLGD